MEKDKRKILIVSNSKSGKAAAIVQALAAHYGAGEVKQALIAGEYPPPPVDTAVAFDLETQDVNGAPTVTFKHLGGTVTGRMSHSHPPFHEIPRQQMPKEWDVAIDPDVREAMSDYDFSKIEERILASLTRDEAVERWAGVDKRKLSPVDQARRFADLYGGRPSRMVDVTSSTMRQNHAQMRNATQQFEALHKQAIANGFRPGTGADWDTYTKVDDDE